MRDTARFAVGKMIDKLQKSSAQLVSRVPSQNWHSAMAYVTVGPRTLIRPARTAPQQQARISFYSGFLVRRSTLTAVLCLLFNVSAAPETVI